MSGVITAIVQDGYCACADDRPVPWWSFSKTVLAAAALTLSAQGRLDLDAPVGGRPFTARQVLRHESGLRDYGALDSYHAAVAAGDAPWSLDELLRRVGRGLLFRPGEGRAYSNVGYLLIRRLIERHADAPLQSALETLVLTPLGLIGPSVADAPDALAATAWGNARGYHPGWAFHGVLIGSAGDAARLLQGLLDGALLPTALLAQMMDWRQAFGPFAAPIEGRPWLSGEYGLGLCRGVSATGRFVGHSGAGPGSTAAVYRRMGVDGLPRTVGCFAASDALGEVEDESIRLAA